ncbi:MAG: aminomethyl-transferring glycine dehydrogenase subunit GcvPB [bacterium]
MEDKQLPLVFELSQELGNSITEKPRNLPAELYRSQMADLPEVPEPRLVRHYHALAKNSFGVNSGPYLLGSCTMKYNPLLSEKAAGLPGFTNTHPRQEQKQLSGWLELLGEMQEKLSRLTGLPYISFLPAAGAHGEWTALRAIGAFFKDKGELGRTEIIVPDSAHGTNPASASMAGFETVEVKSNSRGRVDLNNLKEKCGPQTAALMLTNPNTLGLFETDILKIKEIVHGCGAKLYYDGANLNAFVGRMRPGDMGFDVIHLNLHKTFAAPHGSGGPGSGPVAFSEELASYRPLPCLEKDGGSWKFNEQSEKSIGKIRSFYGNLGVILKAFVYILRMGERGLAQASRDAVLAANYLAANMPEELQPVYPLPCQHEFVVSCKGLPVTAEDFAKRLIDYGIHPPTVYFPLVVDEALMIEPTESLTLQELDCVSNVFQRVTAEAKDDPERFKNYPETTSVSRPDEAGAARQPQLCYRPPGI